MENENFLFFELLESIECDLALLGTLNSIMPRWTDATYESRVDGPVESLKM